MIKRLLSSLVGLVILFTVCLLKNDAVFNIAIVIVSIIGLNEFYNAVRQTGLKPIELPGYICCLLLGLVGIVNTERVLVPILIITLPIIFAVFATIYVFSHLKIKFTDIAVSLLGIVYVPVMMLYLTLIWHMKNGDIKNGYLYVWFVFGGAWLTDTFAYLIGKNFGKHKISRISPNKSVEGCIAGLLGGAIFFGLYAYYLNNQHIVEMGGTELNIVAMTVIGAFISIVSQIGDFTASAIKRQCGIKDFGKIMPGHGGVLDRFDSVLMITPFVFMLFEFLV